MELAGIEDWVRMMKMKTIHATFRFLGHHWKRCQCAKTIFAVRNRYEVKGVVAVIHNWMDANSLALNSFDKVAENVCTKLS